MNVSVIILTYNEEIHIKRCIDSAKLVASSIYVIDSYSTDSTVQIALDSGANVMQRRFISHYDQFNWALSKIKNCDWVIRLDADEYLNDDLVKSLLSKSVLNNTEVNGYVFLRRIKFLNKLIRYGGTFPIEIVRMFRYGFGSIETRLMDEHIKVLGKIDTLKGELIDDNNKPLNWWIDKHNHYSSLEALELLFSKNPKNDTGQLNNKTLHRRNLKNLYLNFPISLRSLFYFSYRYFLRLGFLDGFSGFLFHFYQGLWYRLMVDSKVYTVENYKKINKRENLTVGELSQMLVLSESIVNAKIKSLTEG